MCKNYTIQMTSTPREKKHQKNQKVLWDKWKHNLMKFKKCSEGSTPERNLYPWVIVLKKHLKL